MPDTSWLINAGLLDYMEAWALQKRLAAARAAGAVPDTLILLEHPHTYTLGRSGHMEHLLMDEAERARLGVSVHAVDRGGDITYHGPGQLVIYPIRYLGRPDASGHLPAQDFIGYIRQLEALLIDVLAHYDITARRMEGFTGAWVDSPRGPEKVAAIGVKISAAGVTQHGAALNLDPDLRFFEGIVPCGIPDKGVTSIARLRGASAPSMAELIEVLTSCYMHRFDCVLLPHRLDSETG